MSIVVQSQGKAELFVSLPYCITSHEIYHHINKNVKVHMSMIIVVIASHVLRTSDTVNRVGRTKRRAGADKAEKN